MKKQDAIASKIIPVENDIRNLKSEVKESLEVINKEFANIYNYSESLWLEFGKGMTAGTQKSDIKSLIWYNLNLSKVSISDGLRFSTRFHNPLSKKLSEILLTKPLVTLAEIVSQDIKRGVQPKADKNGDYIVIKTGQLKNKYIDIIETDMVSTDFFDAKITARVQQDDVLLASTGKVSLGKVDVYEFEDEAIVDGHIAIIRVDKAKYNIWFLTYFLRSILGTFQIERDYIGATNQIELYAEQISRFQIPDITMEQQECIVTRIKSKLSFQKSIEQKINEKRNHIKLIITEALLS